MNTRKPWDHGGKTREDRHYGRQHRALRAQLLAAEPLCRPCKQAGRTTAATIADHVVPLAKGGAPNCMENLQPICADCHLDKTNADNGKRVRQRFGADGWPL